MARKRYVILFKSGTQMPVLAESLRLSSGYNNDISEGIEYVNADPRPIYIDIRQIEAIMLLPTATN